MTDADFTEQRIKMVDGQIRTTDVTSNSLLAAMLTVPREIFVPPGKRELAYIDEDLLISGEGSAERRYLMEPSPFAKLVQLADIAPGDAVLDVGAGTGYASAIFSKLAASVTALESDAALAEQARANLSMLSCVTVSVVQGPLAEGYAPKAPYDVIFVGGSVPEAPKALISQLREGGRLVVVEGNGNSGGARIYLMMDGVATGRRAFNAAVKPLSGFERTAVFEF